MIVVVGSFRLPPERRHEAQAAMAHVVAQSRAEAGCLAYAYAEDIVEPGLFRVSEAWSDREALAAHFATPHMRQWQERRLALGMTDREIRAYASDAGEAL